MKQAARPWQRHDGGEAMDRWSTIVRSVQADWNWVCVLVFGAAVIVLASLVTIAYYINGSSVPTDPDSLIYLLVAHQVSLGQFVDPTRTPAYPIFILFVSHIGGRQNLTSVSIAQGVLYVLATIGVYWLAFLLVRRPWAAFIVASLVATNVMLLSFVRPIMTEAQALFLLVCLALAIVAFVRMPQARTLWLAMGTLFVLGMTRPEWLYFAVLFVLFALLVAWNQGKLRRLLPHALAASVLFAGLCGLYLYGNAQNGYVGFGQNQNADLLGKVMQYHMQNEAPTQYATITNEVNSALARGDMDPWHVIFADPALLRDHYNLAATYGRTVILHHPVEFIADTIPLIFDSLRATDSHQPIVANGPFSGVLLALQALAALAQYTLLLFPFIAIAWWGRLIYLFRFRPRQPDTLTVAMAGLSLICAYDLAITTLFVYTQYSRMNAPVDPLMLIVVWGTIIPVGLRLAHRFSRRHEGAVVQTVGEEDNTRLASV